MNCYIWWCDTIVDAFALKHISLGLRWIYISSLERRHNQNYFMYMLILIKNMRLEEQLLLLMDSKTFSKDTFSSSFFLFKNTPKQIQTDELWCHMFILTVYVAWMHHLVAIAIVLSTYIHDCPFPLLQCIALWLKTLGGLTLDEITMNDYLWLITAPLAVGV